MFLQLGLLFISLLWSPYLHGSNSDSGGIHGRVFLKQGRKPINGAVVTIVELNRSAVTDPEGVFYFKNVPGGSYHLIGELENIYKTLPLKINSKLNTISNVELLLDITEKSEITVTSKRKLIPGSHSIQSVQVIDQLAMSRAQNIASGLGELIGHQPGTGITSQSNGPGPSRPTIRGLSGNRVMITTDGLQTASIGGSSDHHSEPFNPLELERVEIIKGPATLLYGGNAIGGVVNGVTGHETFGLHPKGSRGYLQGSAGTTNNLASTAAGLEYSTGNWTVWGGGNGLRTSDYTTPKGKIEGTYSGPITGYGGFGRFRDDSFFSATFRKNRNKFGLPLHEHDHEGEHEEVKTVGVQTEQQNVFQVKWGILPTKHSMIENFTINLNYSSSLNKERHRDEHYATENMETQINNEHFVYKGIIEQSKKNHLTGRFGLSGLLRDFSPTGTETYNPPTYQRDFSLFFLEELTFEQIILEFGGRLDNTYYRPSYSPNFGFHENHNLQTQDHTPRTFIGGSAAIGVTVDLRDDVQVNLNLSRSIRPPAIEELYSYGPHSGSLLFEIGNPNLQGETNNSVDFSLRHQGKYAKSSLSVFTYNFKNFIFPSVTAKQNQGLPVLDFVQRDSVFKGGEASLVFFLREYFNLNLGMDFVHAKETEFNRPLPRIPPLRGKIGFEYLQNRFSFQPELELADRQNRTFDLETATAGYAVVNLNSSYLIPTGTGLHQFTVNFFNISDRLYRNHLSFIKNLAPEIGRGVKLSYTFRFF